jgi:hypothetical protein
MGIPVTALVNGVWVPALGAQTVQHYYYFEDFYLCTFVRRIA